MRHEVDGKRENYSRVLLRAHAVQSLQVRMMIIMVILKDDHDDHDISNSNVNTDCGYS